MSSSEINTLTNVNVNFKLPDSFKTSRVKEFMSQFVLSDDTTLKIMKLLQKDIETGLKQDEPGIQNVSSVSMKVTFFTELFDGTESGNYTVIHLNKRYLLLALVEILPGFSPETKMKCFTVSEDIRRAPYIRIFEYMSDCMLEFFTQHNLLNQTQIVGFCSDFPTVQFGINDCTVCYFTEDAFNFPLNCYDVVRCFEIVLLKPKYKDIKIDLVAIMAENTSMLMASSYSRGNVDMLVNFENDCDVLYWEDRNKIKKWKRTEPSISKVLIDTELRNFGSTGCLDFISTDHDWYLISKNLNSSSDKHCILTHLLQLNSTLDLVKQILLSLHHNLLYCRTANIESLRKKGVSLTDLCDIVNSTSLDHAAVLLPGGTVGGSEDDARIANYVCKIVLTRSAQLKSICIATLLSRLQTDDLLIVVNDSLLWKYLDYQTYVRNLIQELAPKKKIQFLPPTNNSIFVGVALATAIAHKMDKTILHF